MARSREFDPDEAIEKAMSIFWKKGYSDTSVRDLVQATNVAHAGLYSAFKDKNGLFKEVLKHYDTSYGDMLFGPMEQKGAGLPQIKGFFDFVLDAIKTNRFQNGCLMVNTSVEFGNATQEILKQAQNNTERLEKALLNALSNAKNRQQVRGDLDIEKGSALLITTFYGIAILARSKIPYEMSENSVEQALNSLT
ncbi:MAG: TetR/AcrR family transcriptional regulator [Methyloligellaceae bacterium]